jgi:hypothetical protein
VRLAGVGLTQELHTPIRDVHADHVLVGVRLLDMISACVVVKMLGRDRYQRFLDDGLLSPTYNAPGLKNEPAYPAHLVTFRMQEDDRLSGRSPGVVRKQAGQPRQVGYQVRKSLIRSRVQKPPRRVYLQRDQEPGREVSPEVERSFEELLALARKVARVWSY